MTPAADDFGYIAQRMHEIRAAEHSAVPEARLAFTNDGHAVEVADDKVWRQITMYRAASQPDFKDWLAAVKDTLRRRTAAQKT